MSIETLNEVSFIDIEQYKDICEKCEPIDISPDPNLMFVMSQTGKDLVKIIMDLFDNSIDALATSIRLFYNAKDHTLILLDNGSGMTPEELGKALKAGCSSKGNFSSNMVGRWGVGLKLVLFALASKYQIETKTAGDDSRTLVSSSTTMETWTVEDIYRIPSEDVDSSFTKITLFLRPEFVFDSHTLNRCIEEYSKSYSYYLTNSGEIIINDKKITPAKIVYRDDIFPLEKISFTTPTNGKKITATVAAIDPTKPHAWGVDLIYCNRAIRTHLRKPDGVEKYDFGISHFQYYKGAWVQVDCSELSVSIQKDSFQQDIDFEEMREGIKNHPTVKALYDKLVSINKSSSNNKTRRMQNNQKDKLQKALNRCGKKINRKKLLSGYNLPQSVVPSKQKQPMKKLAAKKTTSTKSGTNSKGSGTNKQRKTPTYNWKFAGHQIALKFEDYTDSINQDAIKYYEFDDGLLTVYVNVENKTFIKSATSGGSSFYSFVLVADALAEYFHNELDVKVIDAWEIRDTVLNLADECLTDEGDQ